MKTQSFYISLYTFHCFLQLKTLGYTNVHGSDPCEAMLDEAKKNNIYQNYLYCATGAEHNMPIEDGSYDATVICGGIPHIREDGLEEMIRITKPGGLFVCGGRTTYLTIDAQWLVPALDRLETEGKVEKLEVTVPEEKFYMDQDALIFVYKVLV